MGRKRAMARRRRRVGGMSGEHTRGGEKKSDGQKEKTGWRDVGGGEGVGGNTRKPVMVEEFPGKQPTRNREGEKKEGGSKAESDLLGGWRACDPPCENGYCFEGQCVCLPGYHDEICSDFACDPLDASSCGMGRGVCDTDTGKCRCFPGWAGTWCQRAGCQADCSGHGSCHLGVPSFLRQLEPPALFGPAFCICHTGYLGEYCQEKEESVSMPDEVDAELTTTEADCPNACSQIGLCRAGRCLCPGNWTGLDCSVPVCYLQCSGQGVCQAETGRCRCLDGFFGEGCELRRCHPPDCNQRGSCDTLTSLCHCFAGSYGPGCDWRCPERCNFPKGRCVQVLQQDHRNQSDLDLNTDRILNNDLNQSADSNNTNETMVGTDDDPVRSVVDRLSEFKCQCEEGWTGSTCADRDCGPFFKGPNCDKKKCPYDCSGPTHGVCDHQTLACLCLAGWQGVGCELKPCPDNCNARGLCIPGGICQCSKGFYGVACESGRPLCTDQCQNNGICSEGACFCENGWKGKYCEIPHQIITLRELVHDSTTSDAQTAATQEMARNCQPKCHQEHGFCQHSLEDGIHKYVCLCVDGWTGADCTSRDATTI
eukprot:gb/GEZN01003789.1/.p1 GENE.gb/GEZN01003789.1/~~gb/GEZN01003789.1/.p1  ORF type:complete len:595 (+),score=49.24 gb/GEZN01003789.1/:32-1816(+)